MILYNDFLMESMKYNLLSIALNSVSEVWSVALLEFISKLDTSEPQVPKLPVLISGGSCVLYAKECLSDIKKVFTDARISMVFHMKLVTDENNHDVVSPIRLILRNHSIQTQFSSWADINQINTENHKVFSYFRFYFSCKSVLS